MAKAENDLTQYGLSIRHIDDGERMLVDFAIEDGEDNVAWVWGNSYDDVDWECNHPDECLEFGGDDEYGTCALCGSLCGWNWADEWLDEGHDERGDCIGKTIQVRKVYEWFGRKSLGGILGNIVKEMKADEERS